MSTVQVLTQMLKIHEDKFCQRLSTKPMLLLNISQVQAAMKIIVSSFCSIKWILNVDILTYFRTDTSNGLKWTFYSGWTSISTKAHSTADNSPGKDRFHYSHIKHLLGSFFVLYELYNLIWHKQIRPSSWKYSTIITILNNGKDPSSVISYRPNALTSCLCKMMGRI